MAVGIDPHPNMALRISRRLPHWRDVGWATGAERGQMSALCPRHERVPEGQPAVLRSQPGGLADLSASVVQGWCRRALARG
jgi:hypothetical protein